MAVDAIECGLRSRLGQATRFSLVPLDEAQRHARDRGFLWKLEKDGRTSWLYGTVHVARLEWAFPGPRGYNPPEPGGRR